MTTAVRVVVVPFTDWASGEDPCIARGVRCAREPADVGVATSLKATWSLAGVQSAPLAVPNTWG